MNSVRINGIHQFVAIIVVAGHFLYGGVTVRVGSKQISRLEIYEGYAFTQDAFTATGTVTPTI